VVDPFPVTYVGVGLFGSGWLVAGFFMTQMARGKLIARNFYADRLKELETEHQRADELAQQNGILLREFGPTLQKFLVDLRTAAREIRDEAEADRTSGDEAPEEKT